MNETKIWIIFQEISKQRLFVGVYSQLENAENVVKSIINKEEEQNYNLVGQNLWYGTTRKIEVVVTVLDRNPVK